jgi:hypothetical protein
MKIDQKYVCEICDYNTSKKSNWNEHILTEKHKRLDLSVQQISNKRNPAVCYDCEICDVKCSHLSILNRHKTTKKHLKSSQVHEKSSRDSATEILMKENQELRNLIIEQAKLYAENMNNSIVQNANVLNKAIESCRPINNTINNTNNTNNTNNNKFNINLFLNEQCKDAFNFTEFVNNIKISYQDLENNAQLGFVQGISKIFMDNLKQLDISERPIHCTDVKRETMYIKDEDKWTKEVDDSKLQKAIQTVSYKSMGKLMEWKQENPDYQDADSDFSKRCLDIQRQSLAGSEREVYYPKVIHALAKETMVDK